MDCILDHVITEGKGTPMTEVIDRSYASDPKKPIYTNSVVPGPGGMSSNVVPKVLIKEIIPMVEESFRIIACRDHREMDAFLWMISNRFRRQMIKVFLK